MDSEQNTYFPLRTGPVTLGIRFNTPGSTSSFTRYFTGYKSRGKPDLFIDITVESHHDFPDIPQSLVQAKLGGGNTFTIGDSLFRGRYIPERNTWEVTVKNMLTKGRTTRVFEQFLYQAFYSACRRSGTDAVLLHSCGVCVDGHGFLFVGPSGSGKSTVAELSRNYGILNDEMNIMTGSGAPFRIEPSPFNAYFKAKSKSPAPVAAVFLLRHGAQCRLEPVTPAAATAEITAQVVPPIALEDSYTPVVLKEMLVTAMHLASSVPVFELYFPLEGGFWPLVLDRFN